MQHAFTMFGATVLVPYLTGIPVNLALFTAGLGTLIFHAITKWKVPVFLGSSFAYISPMIAVTLYYLNNAGYEYDSIQDAVSSGVDLAPMLGYATGAIIIAGGVKVLIGLVIKLIGIRRFEKLFPPIVSGTMIMLIGLILSPVAVKMASNNWTVALISLGVAVFARLYMKGFNRLVPVIWGIAAGYIAAVILGEVSFSNLAMATWFSTPKFIMPKFSLFAISVIVPVAIAPSIEHFGDVFAVSAIVGKKFYEDPGMHRTLMGDGIATATAGILGGPACTTYSENTGVLAITKVFNPWVMRIAAIFAIILSFIPKVGALVQSIPQAVMGGIEFLLFGMIASIGIKTLVQNKVKIDGKNLIVASIMLVSGLGGVKLSFGKFTLQGLGLAAVVGFLVNLIFSLTRASED
ncbi:uracil transporter [Kosmotoga pacifica]|uniref:Uracil transporter n=2 Tax=Kosmotoga pacifica TaxID=1330330 RepID=A0A0G2ZHN6_9BACT|nr:uracil transporter [Kosmotoga pacifica]